MLFRNLSCFPVYRKVEYFGPHAREMIKTSMDQDQMNSENLRKMEADLRNAGDSECADRIVQSSVSTVCSTGSIRPYTVRGRLFAASMSC